jgi:hypothetical protein
MDVIGVLCVSLGNSTVQLLDSLGSRQVCAWSEAGFSSQNGTVLEGGITQEQSSVMEFLWAKGLTKGMSINKYFLFTVESIPRVKTFIPGLRNVAKVSLMTKNLKRRRGIAEITVKRLRAADFDSLVKLWDKCINVGGGYVEK